ncbi:glycosyltransferase [Apilactobacillus bombintestini]|uniref:Glycosyltransferase n=1 Tax=Apilactobacillus bombintestini TaxID=2419772 RepID=A0A387B1I2_9LACO|nr:glycosyltransferase [Apilactobacillus bombintestini]AYF93000.1 glycosyltransferase [Apilactobacillus bombintestini]
MYFFLNSSFNAKNSGIEHAQLKRAQLFEKFNTDYKLVFRDWNPLLHLYLNAHGIADQHILNVFDYFQEARYVKPKTIHPRDIDFGIAHLTYKKDEQNHRVLVYNQNTLVGRINVFTEEDTKPNIVKSVELFDGFSNLYCVDFYDYRGFKSLSQWYTPDNQVATQTWYTPAGRPAIENFMRLNGQQKLAESGYKTIDAHGTVRPHLNKTSLLTEFLEAINLKYFDTKQANIYVLDRGDFFEEILTDLNSPTYSVLHLHSSQAGDSQKADTSIMNNNYEYSLTDLNRYDAIVASTHKQNADVQARFHHQVDAFTIPVGVLSARELETTRVPMNKRRPHSMVITARVSPEKQIDKIITAMGMAKKQVPDINLNVYGYVDHSNNDAAIKRINAAIKKYDLQDAVTLHDYTLDVPSVQANAQVYPLASVMEGFNLALMEAQSNGDVGITFDTNYGPNELIVDQENGYVVKYDDTEALSKKMVELFTHDDLLQAMSDKAYELSQRYSSKQVWQKWQQLTNRANQVWQDKLKTYRVDITDGLEDMEHAQEEH